MDGYTSKAPTAFEQGGLRLEFAQRLQHLRLEEEPGTDVKIMTTNKLVVIIFIERSFHLHKFDLHMVRAVDHHAAAGLGLPGRRIHDAIRDKLAAPALQLLV